MLQHALDGLFYRSQYSTSYHDDNDDDSCDVHDGGDGGGDDDYDRHHHQHHADSSAPLNHMARYVARVGTIYGTNVSHWSGSDPILFNW